MWQDTIILICSLIFGFLLIPQIRDMYRLKVRMNLLSCVTTTVALGVLSWAYASLGLPLALIGGVIDTIAWAVITVFSVRYYSL
jgi:hypothetical protein